MTLDALIMLSGALVSFLSVAGFPSSWYKPMFFVLGVFVIALGIVYAFIFKIDVNAVWHGASLHLPRLQVLTRQDLLTGLVVLAVPQIPLSLGNSILATRQVAEDFFPERPLTIRQLSFT